MSVKAALSTKLKGPPAPTGDPLDLSTQTPQASQAQGSGFTTRQKLPVILTATGGATPATADPIGVSSTNLMAPAFQKPEAVTSTTPIPAGSGWDTGSSPEGTNPNHLQEWVKGSGVHPALAAANVQTLAGNDVLDVLIGKRLGAMSGEASQYATAPVSRLINALEIVAAAGGWWCSGLDPLANWAAPMEWGCYKGDAPRKGPDGKTVKYEHPQEGQGSIRSFWLRVPSEVAPLTANRFGLALPAEVVAEADGSAGAFWRWWAQTPELPLVITEGAKKAAALLSIGIPAVGMAGIWNGCPKGADGKPALLADLAGVPLVGRRVMVVFDNSRKRNPAEPVATERLGRLLEKAGADVLVGICPATHGKGVDDHLVRGGSWDDIEAALAPLPVEPLGEQPAKQLKARRLRPDEIRDRITQHTGPLRLNTRTGYVEADGEPLTGNGISHLYLKLSTPTETWGREVTTDAATFHAMQDQFDPVAEWLTTNTVEPLPMDQWERIEEHSLGLADDPLSGQIIRRWLIGAIARAIEPGCWWRVAPVLVGEQNIGKTEWIRALAGDGWFLSGLGRLDRDAMQRLRRGWLVELGELDGITRKADQEQLKAFLTERVDTYRSPYARTDEAHPRRCVFIGTANASPLRDSTGSSRFAVIKTGSRPLPVEWVKQNRAAIWARALEQYRSGIPWTHPQAEMEAIRLRNEGHTVLDPWQEVLAEKMELAAKTGRPVQNAEIYNLLEVEVAKQTAQTAERVARIMQALGWEKSRRRCDGRRREGWWPVEPASNHEPAPQAPPAPPAAVEPMPAPITQPAATVAPPAPVKAPTKTPPPWHAEAWKIYLADPSLAPYSIACQLKTNGRVTGKQVAELLKAGQAA